MYSEELEMDSSKVQLPRSHRDVGHSSEMLLCRYCLLNPRQEVKDAEGNTGWSWNPRWNIVNKTVRQKVNIVEKEKVLFKASDF